MIEKLIDLLNFLRSTLKDEQFISKILKKLLIIYKKKKFNLRKFF